MTGPGPDERPPDAEPADQPPAADRPRPSPGARAASRARRIGGGTRSVPAPERHPSERSASEGPPPGRPAPEPRPEPDERPGDGGAGDTAAALARRPGAPRWLVLGRHPGGASNAPRWAGWLPAAVAGAAAATLLVLCVVFSHGVWWAKPSSSSAREQVLAAAKSCFATMNTYDYRKLDAAEAAGAKCATKAMAAQYRKAFDTQIKPRAATAKFTQTAQVNAAGIESVSEDGKQWVLLMFGQLQITNSSTTPGTPRLDILMAEVTVDKVGDRWLISAYNYA